MTRRPFNLACLVSFLLCSGTAALWVRSYGVNDNVEHAGAGGTRDWFCYRLTSFDSRLGRLVVTTHTETYRDARSVEALRRNWAGPEFPATRWTARPRPREPVWLDGASPAYKSLGFAVWSRRARRCEPWDPPHEARQQVFAAPHWFAALLLAVLPVRWLRQWSGRRRRERRAAAGLCGACGYDLRESRNRCPECGAAPAAA